MSLDAALPIAQLKVTRKLEHPWIYASHIHKPEPALRPGTLVNVTDASGRWTAYAHYNGHARIALRLLSLRKDQPIDADWFAGKIIAAVSLRERLGISAKSDAYRVVNSEGDALSGLIVDRFAGVLVTQYFSAGMFKQREVIRAVLDQHFPGSGHYWFTDRHVGKQESFDCHSPPTPAPVIVTELGLKFYAAPGAGHKTGFFADQRDNRALLAELCQGASVLDVCCNSGGFAIYAKAKGGAAHATGIDLDTEVLELAQKNAELNSVTIDWQAADLFEFLARPACVKAFDVVVLDPAKQTRSVDKLEEALRRYFAMNKLAIAAVKPGGWLLSCSCTGLVDEIDFIDMLRAAATAAQRSLQIVRVAGAGGDHPVMAHAPESRYLKAVFARVI